MEYKDYYKTLGVEKTASQAAIKKAYRRLAKKYHPDLHPGDAHRAEQFKNINEAYEVLGDAEKRSKYDQFGDGYSFQGGQNFDPSDFGFTGFSQGQQAGSYTYTTTGQAGGFSDFFDLIFGGRGFSKGGKSGFSAADLGDFSRSDRHRATRPQAPHYNGQLDLSLQEAFTGGEKSLSFTVEGQQKEGVVKWPAGIQDGQKIKIRGQRFGLEGTLYLKVRIHSEVEIQGLDLIQDLSLPPWTAYVGGQVAVQTLQGKIKVKVPKGASSGLKIRIPAQGYRDRQGKRGDLYLRVMIQNPASLPADLEALYRRLEKKDSL